MVAVVTPMGNQIGSSFGQQRQAEHRADEMDFQSNAPPPKCSLESEPRHPAPGGGAYVPPRCRAADRFDEAAGGAPAPQRDRSCEREDRDRSPDSVMELPDQAPAPRCPRGVLKRSHSEPSWARGGRPGGRDYGVSAFDESAGSSSLSDSSGPSSQTFDEDMDDADSPEAKRYHGSAADDVTDALERARSRGAAPKIRKSVSFHTTVTMVRSESLTALPSEEKNRIWYRSSDYSKFVHSELGRRREMGVTSTSLIMPSSIAHREPSLETLSDEDDAPMEPWSLGLRDDSSCDGDDDGGDDDRGGSPDRRPAPVRVVG